MKNLLTTFTIIFCLFTAILSAQETQADKEAPTVPEKTKNEAPTVPEKTPEAKEAKVKFGSKLHRAKLDKTPGKVESTENILWKTCLSLAAVIAIILLIFSVLRKVNSKFNNVGAENPMRIHSKLVVDSKNYLALVRVYEEEILISVGPNGSTMLAKYALVDKEDAEGTDFESVLNNEGKSVVPIDPEKHISSFELKPIKELKK